MKITYDQQADAAYIRLNDKKPYRSSQKITDDVLVDYSKDGMVVGIEVLAASENMPMATIGTMIAIESPQPQPVK